MSDRAVVALALAAALGAHVSSGPHPLVGVLVAVVAVLVQRPWLLCVAAAVLTAGLAERALAGLDPVEPRAVEGWVTLVSDPEPVGGGVRADVRIDGQRVEANAHGAAAGALAERLVGERVELTGRLQRPPPDAPWLVRRRVVGRLAVDEVVGWRPGSVLSRLANGLRRTLVAGAEPLPDHRRALLTGVVLGDDRFQPAEITDDFRATGLTHLLAVSGQNVAFVLVVAGPFLRRTTWRLRLAATLGVIAFFALLTRFEPSVLRASAMAALAAVATALGRQASGIRVLALAVTGLLIVDPLLIGSLGFGLSVGASAGILLFAPRLAARIPGPRVVAESLAVTLAAQVGVIPLLVPAFGSIPVATVPANLLAVPSAGPLMTWGLTGGVLAGVVGEPLRSALHLPSGVLLWWLESVARWFATLPLGELRVHGLAVAGGATVGVVTLRRVPRLVAALVLVTAVAAPSIGRVPPRDGPTELGLGAVLHRDASATLLVVDGRVRAEPLLRDLRLVGTRCVDLAVATSAAAGPVEALAALGRRCPAAVIAAPVGRAPPGWAALPRPSETRIGALLVVVDGDGTVSVGR